MTARGNPDDASLRPARERAAWRLLVGAQVGVVALILLAVVAIYLVGAFGQLFAQRPL